MEEGSKVKGSASFVLAAGEISRVRRSVSEISHPTNHTIEFREETRELI